MIIIKEKRFCKNCGKELTDVKGRNIYCNNKCQNEYHYHLYIQEWRQGNQDGTNGVKYKDVSGYVRRYLFEKYSNKCCKCGWGEINQFTQKTPLEIHHKDGNCLNNKEDNLELLCPNCHSLTENYGARNKGKSKRHYKRIY